MALDQLHAAEPEQPGKEMSFLEHLDELRAHLMRSAIAIVSVGVILFFFKDWLFEEVIFAPSRKDFFSYKLFCTISDTLGLQGALCFEPPAFKTQAIGFAEAFITSIKISFIAGFIVAFPYVFYEFWRFISPGLYDEERKATRGIVVICSFLFMMGVAFGYYIISPFAINFLAGYTLPGVENIPTLASLISYMVMFTAPAGLIFELPMVVYFLTKVGLLSSETMRKYRRHSVIVLMMLAALITPPDVVTQFLIGIPLYILYEISIFVAKGVEKRQAKEMA